MKKKTIGIILALALSVCFSMPAFAVTALVPNLAILTPALYDEFGAFSEGLIWVKEGNVYKYLDTDGSVVIDGITADTFTSRLEGERALGGFELTLGGFHEDYAAIGIGADGYIGQSYYIDRTGDILQINWDGEDWTDSNFGSGCAFSEGYAVIQEPNADVITTITKDGLVRMESIDDGSYEWYETGDIFNEGLVTLFTGSYDGPESAGYMSPDFSIAIPLQFEDARPFNQGLAPVKSNGYWGFIDTSGNFVIQPQFDDFKVADSGYSYTVFNDGLAAVKKGDAWGYIDKSGNTVVPFEFNDGASFLNSYATPIKDGVLVAIDTSGNIMTQLPYDDVNGFYNGAAFVGQNGVYKFIDGNGNALSDQTWNFEGTRTFGFEQPDVMMYQQGGKWGMARFSSAAPIPGTASDTPSAWAVEQVNAAIAANIVHENLQSKYTQAATRAEFAALAAAVYETVTGGEISERTTFSDTSDVNVEKAAAIGVVTGVGENMFDPDTALTREQAAVMLARLAVAVDRPLTDWDENTSVPLQFSDWGSISDWAFRDVGQVQTAGIMQGVGNDLFAPQDPYTREQSIITIMRLYDYVTGA